MAGIPLARATSADRGWVYTLYNGGTSHAFVHALDTKHRTARCIDLPWHGEDQNGLERRAHGAARRHARPQPAAVGVLATVDLRSFAVDVKRAPVASRA